MQTIGERLEEARKKRGVSLQDAAESTKIRDEYLAALEANSLKSIPLETIYIRGFIRNYAKFLRIDPSKLLADFDASNGNAKDMTVSAKAQKELIGRLEMGASEAPAPSLEEEKENSP
jgi:cytoskeletal protein RodZ